MQTQKLTNKNTVKVIFISSDTLCTIQVTRRTYTLTNCGSRIRLPTPYRELIALAFLQQGSITPSITPADLLSVEQEKYF